VVPFAFHRCGNSLVQRMSFKEQFNNWMLRLNRVENPSDEIIAFNFGLFETETGYTLYLTGAKHFDENDPDWATAEDFEPEEKYFPIPHADTKGLKWEQVLEKTKAIVEAYLSTDDFRNSFLKNAKAITTGFDDGDLFRVK
jgi:hypothetical protein